MKEFFYSFSNKSFYQRFFTHQVAMPHSKLQHLVNPDYDEEMALTALIKKEDRELIIAVGRYYLDRQPIWPRLPLLSGTTISTTGLAHFCFSTSLKLQKRGVLEGFKAEILAENLVMLHVIHKCGYPVQSKLEDDSYSISIIFDR